MLVKRWSHRRSEGFPRTRISKKSCACDCGRGPVFVGVFFFPLRSFFLSSFFLLSVTQNRAIKFSFFVKKRCFKEGARCGPGEEGKYEKNTLKKNEKKTKKRKKKKKKKKHGKEPLTPIRKRVSRHCSVGIMKTCVSQDLRGVPGDACEYKLSFG